MSIKYSGQTNHANIIICINKTTKSNLCHRKR